MTPSPADVLEQLCDDADPRRAASLRAIHAVCEQLYADASRDFSYKAIGRLSQLHKGPGVRALLNPAGAPYRQLIEAHRERAMVSAGRAKVLSKADRDGLLDGVKDPAQRARIELMRTEVASLRRQIQMLQRLANDSAVITVEASSGDSGIPAARTGHYVSVDLLPLERDALRDAFDPQRLAAAGLEIDSRGRVLLADGRIAFPLGFATAMRKIAKEFGATALAEFGDSTSVTVTEASA